MMAVNYPTLIAAIRARDPVELRRQFEGTAKEDLTEAATFVGPVRLRAAVETFPGRANEPLADLLPTTNFLSAVPAGPEKTARENVVFQILVEVLRQGFGVTTSNVPEELRLPNIAYYLVASGIVAVAARRKIAPLVTLAGDLTGTLPATSANPAAITESDYAAAALRNAIPVAAIKAVAEVESGGRTGFDDQRRPKILFEAHHFGRLSKHVFDKTHPHLSNNDYKKSSAYYGWAQYNRMHEALLLDADAALGAASWGKFQVMGFNHNGWPDVRAFVAAMYVSEANHLKSFEAYCNDNDLMGFVRRKDWTGFAKGYNGPKQVGYDTRIANAYRKHGGS